MTITLWAIARNANDIEPAVTVRMAKPLTSGICEARHATSTTSRTATPTVQPWRRANRENWLDGSGNVVTTPSKAVTAMASPAGSGQPLPEVPFAQPSPL